MCCLEPVTSRKSLSISLVLPLPLFFLLFSSPDTISWGNPFIYAFFYTANAYKVSESHTPLVSALYLKSQEKRDVIYRHVVIDTDESFFFFFFCCGPFLKSIESVTILILFYVLVFWPPGMWYLSSLNRDLTYTPVLEGEVLTTGPPGKTLKAIF